MEANPLVVGLAAVVVAGALAPAVGAADPASHPPNCDPIQDTAGHENFHAARIRSTGYVEDAPDVLPVDETATGPAGFLGGADVLEDESFKGHVARDVHVVAEPLALVYGGVTNNPDLVPNEDSGYTPSTTVEARADGLLAEVGTETFTGATRLKMTFTGRIIVYAEKTVECGSYDGGTLQIPVNKVELQGFGTKYVPGDGDQEAWGTGLDVRVRDGPHQKR